MVEALTAETVARRNNVTVLGRQDGPVMLFAHGYGCDQDVWRRLVPYFADHYRVVLFDNVGAGHSDAEAYDRAKYGTLDGYAADILEICSALDLTDVILVGHSVSAIIALIAAANEPERFSRLILVAPSPRYIDDAADGYVGGFTQADIDGLLASLDSNYFAWAEALAPMAMGNPDAPEYAEELRSSFCRTNPAIARHFARVTFLSDSRYILDRVRCDSLVLQCTDDLLAPAEVGSYVHRHLDNSSLVHLQATGHCPHVSAPAATAHAILQYLQPRP